MEDDRERTQLLQRILDLLLAGGYFRAGIVALSVFDKLTGGLAWCITFSRVDVDFDVLYDDDATLYYKIKVGEAIQDALRRMGCPHPLQAHQIQGLDYQAVHPVVQWLVKRVMATREEFGDQARGYAHLRYQENYKMPNETSFQNARMEKIEDVVQSSLQKPLQKPEKTDLAVATSQPSSKAEAVTTEAPEDEPIAQKTATTDPRAEAPKDEPIAQKIAITDPLAVAKEEPLVTSIPPLQTEVLKPKAQKKVQAEAQQKLQKSASPASRSVSATKGAKPKGRPPVSLAEEAEFRADCERKRAEMEARIKRLKDPAAAVSGDDENCAEVNSAYNLDHQKWSTLRTELSRRNVAVALLQRRLDEMPSQTELMQYERRFVELYLHIQRKLRETRKYYATYNALAEGNEVTVKELSLLNSIHTQFEVAMMTSGGRSKFVESMEGIAKGVEQKLHQIEKRFDEEQSTLTTLKDKHMAAVAAQRHYFAVVQRFQEECAWSEKLQLKLEPDGQPGHPL